MNTATVKPMKNGTRFATAATVLRDAVSAKMTKTSTAKQPARQEIIQAQGHMV